MTHQNINNENLAASLIAELSRFDPEALSSTGPEKAKALALSKKLTATLEGPLTRAVDYIFKPFSSVALRMAIGLNLFEILASSTEPFSSAELAKRSGGDEILISRILRVVASIDFVEQTGPYEWRANETTNAMALPPISAGHRCDILVKTAMSGTKFLEETGWKNPSEPRDGILQYANQTKLHLFDYLASQPSLFSAFNLFMGATMGSQGYWCDWYDVKGRLIDGYNPENSETLLVDVGGGKGHDLQTFHGAFRTLYKGGLILQDLPGVIHEIQSDSLDPTIDRMGHDFFGVQPIKGARAYFLHHILHDWSDKYCLRILKQLYDAMTPGYSKLLIHELVLPDIGATEMQSRFDLTMMTINSGMERSRHEFTQLLQAVGFTVTGIWEWPDKDGIVEAEITKS